MSEHKQLVEKLKELNEKYQVIVHQYNDERLTKLKDDFFSNQLNVEDLSVDEATFFHTWAHTLFHYKKSPIPKSDLKVLHDKLISKLNNHSKFDKLD